MPSTQDCCAAMRRAGPFSGSARWLRPRLHSVSPSATDGRGPLGLAHGFTPLACALLQRSRCGCRNCPASCTIVRRAAARQRRQLFRGEEVSLGRSGYRPGGTHRRRGAGWLRARRLHLRAADPGLPRPHRRLNPRLNAIIFVNPAALADARAIDARRAARRGARPAGRRARRGEGHHGHGWASPAPAAGRCCIPRRAAPT